MSVLTIGLFKLNVIMKYDLSISYNNTREKACSNINICVFFF